MMIYVVSWNTFAGSVSVENGPISLPRTYKEAIRGPHSKQWQAAFEAEFNSLAKHKVLNTSRLFT